MRLTHHEELYIAGRAVVCLGREIRGPLCVLHKLAGSWEIDVKSHRTSDGEFWFSLSFRSVAAAIAAFAKCRALYPNAKTTREVIEHSFGGRPVV